MEKPIQQIEKLRTDLQEILTQSQTTDNFELAWDKLGRWKERGVKIISRYVSEHEASKFEDNRMMTFSMNDELGNFIHDVKLQDAFLEGLLDEIKANPEFVLSFSEIDEGERLIDISPLSKLENLCLKFHRVARQLRNRHNNRQTLTVEDEYDVQDLFHALLKIEFDDIRPEEWTESYAGKSSRTDFLLKNEKVIVEIKKTRTGLAEKEIGDQLLIDIARYKNHSGCKTLVCFVYDPEGKIGNPTGLINDLEQNSTEDLNLKIIIEPKE